MKTEAEILLSIRNTYSLSQWQLAKRLGYTSPQFVSNIERGLCGLPLESVKIIKAAYGMRYAKLLVEAKRKDFEDKLSQVF